MKQQRDPSPLPTDSAALGHLLDSVVRLRNKFEALRRALGSIKTANCQLIQNLHQITSEMSEVKAAIANSENDTDPPNLLSFASNIASVESRLTDVQQNEIELQRACQSLQAIDQFGRLLGGVSESYVVQFIDNTELALISDGAQLFRKGRTLIEQWQSQSSKPLPQLRIPMGRYSSDPPCSTDAVVKSPISDDNVFAKVFATLGCQACEKYVEAAKSLEYRIILALDELNRKRSTGKTRDRHLEARDKWIYEQTFNGVPYDTIRLELKNKPIRWRRISSKQGIQSAARRYAKRHNLAEPPARQER